MVYQWQFTKYKADAQETGELFSDIEAREGSLTPENVLEEARKPASIIHDDFEWNNGVAAEKYRLDQARKMISSIVVIPQSQAREPVRAFVNTVSGFSKGSYINVGKAMKSTQIRSVVLDNAKRELRAIQNKYRKYSEFDIVSNAIDDFINNN